MAIIKGKDYTPTHRELIDRMSMWLERKYNCPVTLLERLGHGGTGESPDILAWRADGKSYLIEVKISRSDFHADKHKPWRRNMDDGLGQTRYYAAPKGILKPEDIPAGWGLLSVTEHQVRELKQPEAIKQNETAVRAEMAMLIRALRDLRLGAVIVQREKGEG